MTGYHTDDRAVATTMGYVLGLAIATLLVTGLLFAGGDLLQGQRDQAIRSELEVIGQQLAGGVNAADRVARTDGTTEVVVRRTLPERTAGSQYTISIAENALVTDGYDITLTSTDLDVTVTVQFTSRTDVAATTLGSGEVVIRYTAASGQLEVEND